MLEKTRGIVLRYFKYQDTSIIVHIFTEKLGLQSYIVNSVRRKASNKIALFQPLSLLDLVVYHSDKKQIHRIKELRCNYVYEKIPWNIGKSAILIFLSEILLKVIKEGVESEGLFDFINDSLIILDKMRGKTENFHLIFLLKLSHYFGFYPGSPKQMIAEINESTKLSVQLNELEIVFLADIDAELQISNKARRNILNILIAFYQTHFETFSEVKSVKILREVLN
jgi:DNA repair protein RecO (recombination protein O)